MGEPFIFEVWQAGIKVAAVDGPDRYKAMAEAGHYALLYAEDGPVELIERVGRKRTKIPIATRQWPDTGF